jgi:hypothetical protein
MVVSAALPLRFQAENEPRSATMGAQMSGCWRQPAPWLDHLVDLYRRDPLRHNQAAPHRAAPLHDGPESRLVEKRDPAEIFLERRARLECDRTIFPRRLSGGSANAVVTSQTSLGRMRLRTRSPSQPSTVSRSSRHRRATEPRSFRTPRTVKGTPTRLVHRGQRVERIGITDESHA